MIKKPRWIYVPEHSLTLVEDDETLAHYDFSTTEAAKPFVHPLRTSKGTLLTSYQPSDHVWHRGLWFAWKYINGVNYWEEEPNAKGVLASEGATIALKGEKLRYDGDAAVLAHELKYVAPDKSVTMRETRQLVLQPPSDDGTFRLDFSHAFTVGDTDVELSATPVTKETPWGGYAGLGIRTARSLQQFKTLNDEGVAGDGVNGALSKWVDLSGVADGGPKQAAGVTLFDHPQNTRHPSPTYVFNDATIFGYSNLSLVRNEPLTLAAGANLNLAYRVLVHDGWADPSAYDAEWENFAATQPFDFLKNH